MSSLYKKYDLVWEMDGKLVGYKAVVDCVDVSLVPEDLHRHLVRDSTAEYLQPLPALKRNYDLLWEGAGGMEGFNAVVSSRVDLGKLPMILTAHVVPQSDALPRPTFHSWDSANPLYSKTSQLIGHKIEQTKAPHSDETQSWHGLSGKFTSHFPDPGRYGGLNCSMNKNAVTKGPSFGTTPYYEGDNTPGNMGVLAENKTYTQAIAFFDKADGRDKLFKTLQNFSKFLAWHFTIKALTAPNDARPAARQSAARYSKLAKTLSSYRQLHKFFKWLKTIRDIQGVLQNPSDLSPGDVIDTVSSICDVGYKVSDNIEFLTDLKFLDGNAKTWEKQSKFFQFYCYLLAVVYHLLCISRMNEPTKQELSLSDNERRAAHRLRKRKILLDFVKDFADFLRVSVGQGYITFIPKPVVPAFAGIMGTVAGGIGTMQVWEKVAK